MANKPEHFHVIVYDGVLVGLKEAFAYTFLDFDELDEAVAIARVWNNWINGDTLKGES